MIQRVKDLFRKPEPEFKQMKDKELEVAYKLTALGETSYNLGKIREEVECRGLRL